MTRAEGWPTKDLDADLPLESLSGFNLKDSDDVWLRVDRSATEMAITVGHEARHMWRRNNSDPSS